MRPSKRKINYRPLNKSCYSVQTSSYSSVQISPRAASRSKGCVSKARSHVDYLSKEIRKHRRTRTELKGTMELEKKHGENLEQKIFTLKQQLEFVLQQNSKLEVAKNGLVEELQEIIDGKEQGLI